MTDTLLAERRARIANALPLEDAVLIVGAGEPIPLPEGSDQCYPFRSHAEYYYLTGRECSGGIVALDPREGAAAGWKSFVPSVSVAERVWEGRTQSPGLPLGDFESWLSSRQNRRIAQLGAAVRGTQADAELTRRVRESFVHARRKKDSTELALIRRAAAATAAGFNRVARILRPGHTERAIQIELEAEFFRAGATRTGYGTIVGSGPNAAVLHFEPSAREVQQGEFVLIDAGAEIDRYTADVTRTFVAGTPSAFQRDLYQVVLGAQERAITRCVPGAEWKDIHMATATDMVAGLVHMGVLRGAAESLVEQDAHTLFYPHGLGHMVGLGVRDASGLLPGRQKDPRASLRTLRMDLPLEDGYVVTVEPGLYFIPPLLNDAERRSRYKDAVNWPLVDRNLEIGGVRIEDNVLITSAAPEVLTQAIGKKLD